MAKKPSSKPLLVNEKPIKLAAAMAVSFVATRALRALPLAAAGSAVLPIVISALQRKAVARSIR